MEDSLRGVLVVLTLISLFITAILSFITLFPQEQGVSFTDSQSQASYLVIQENNDPGTVSSLTSIDSSTQEGFNDWDITEGFMGSNALKQSSGTSVRTYSKNVFSNIKIIATQLFGSGSPILWVITALTLLAGGYITYLVIQFIRQGR